MAQTTDAINYGDLTGFYDQHMQDVVQPNANKGIPSEAICSTAGGTAAKVTNTTPASFSLVSGAKIVVKFTYAITVANATLQVGESTAKPIYYKGAALGANLVQAGSSILLHYDGTSFNIVGDLNTDTTYSVMGASGSTHASGLVPDTPSTAGTTKFLREDGTWQEPAGSSYTAGDGIDISNDEISVDSTVALKTDLANEKQGNGIGTCSTSSGTALTVSLTNYELVTNGFVAVTFENDVPAGATLNINGKGAKAIYYKGSAIDGDTIKADDTALFSYDGTNYVLISSGGGGSATVTGTIIASLEAYVNDAKTAGGELVGVVVTLTNTSDSEVVGTHTIASGETSATFSGLTPMKSYSVSVSSITGYTQPAAQTISEIGIGTTVRKTLQFEADEYTVSISSNQGSGDTAISSATVTIEGTALSDGDTKKVAKGTSISPTASSVTNYTAAVNTSGKTVSAVYSTEVVTVTCTKEDGGSVAGASVSVNGTSYTLDATGIITAKVAFGTSYSIVPADFGDYSASTQTFTANQVSRSVSVEYSNPDTVDLGLPSGTKWCTHNVGATNPEDYGQYFSWGNTTGHTQGDGYAFSTDNYNQTTGSSLTASFQSGNATYDAARAIMGTSWRVPTKDELQELISNTTQSSETIGGITCVKFTSKINNKYIILPKNGESSGSTYSGQGTYAEYWTSDIAASNSNRASQFFNTSLREDWRHVGIGIRAVK